jgi:hypothetical protein
VTAVAIDILVLAWTFSLVIVWTFFLVCYLLREVHYLSWLLVLSFGFEIILSVKFKVLEVGFGLWLGDNISTLSVVKRGNIFF